MSKHLKTRLGSLAPIPLRLALGFGLLLHGYPKLFSAQGNDMFVGMLSGIGVPAPGAMAYLVGGFEFFGGILLLLGAAVRIVSALGAVEMLVAALTVHLPAGFSFMNVTGSGAAGGLQFGMPGYEVNVLYLAGFLSLLILGRGPMSVPSVRAGRRAEPVEEMDLKSDPEPEPEPRE